MSTVNTIIQAFKVDENKIMTEKMRSMHRKVQELLTPMPSTIAEQVESSNVRKRSVDNQSVHSKMETIKKKFRVAKTSFVDNNQMDIDQRQVIESINELDENMTNNIVTCHDSKQSMSEFNQSFKESDDVREALADGLDVANHTIANADGYNTDSVDPTIIKDSSVTFNNQLSEPHIGSCIKLRDYQKELAELALKRINTIVCAGTNAGKTFVALHVIENHLKANTAGKVAFVTNNNDLLAQQFDTACNYLPALFKQGKIHQWLASKDVTDETLKNLVNRSSIILFITPGALCNYLKDKSENVKVNINEFTLIVLDECHHTYGKDPYNEVMSYYRREKYGNQSTRLPQILGLTASLGTNRAKDKLSAKDHLQKIMANLDVSQLSVVQKFTESLLKHSTILHKVHIPSRKREEDHVNQKLMETMASVEDMLRCKQVTNFLCNPNNKGERVLDALRNPPKDRTTKRYIQWLSESKKKVEEILIDESMELRLLHACFRHLEFYASCVEINSLLDIVDVRAAIKDGLQRLREESQKATEEKEKDLIKLLEGAVFEINKLGIMIEGNPDIERIKETLNEEYKKYKKESRFLIFVKMRTTAKALADKLPKELNSRYLTGSQVSKEEGGLSREEQNDIVKRFREGTHLCVVATSVASEGLDIPQCTLVIRYRLETNEISSLQMKGRIRQSGGKEVLVGSQQEFEKEEINIERQYLMKLAIEMVLKEDVSKAIASIEHNVYQMEEQERERRASILDEKNKGKFYVNCRKCGKFIVDGLDIRRIKQTHTIVCDPEIFQIIDIETTNTEEVHNGITKTDKVSGKCGHYWGSILIFQGCRFVSLSQKRVKICSKATSEPITLTKWCDVHAKFPMDDIEESEIIKYRCSITTSKENNLTS